MSKDIKITTIPGGYIVEDKGIIRGERQRAIAFERERIKLTGETFIDFNKIDRTLAISAYEACKALSIPKHLMEGEK